MTKKKQLCPRGHDSFQGGRDRSGRCLICKAEVAAAREAAEQARIADQQAAFERRQTELDRWRDQEYQATIERGGYDAAMARWDKAYSETLERTGLGLCQWEDEDPVTGEVLGQVLQPLPRRLLLAAQPQARARGRSRGEGGERMNKER